MSGDRLSGHTLRAAAGLAAWLFLAALQVAAAFSFSGADAGGGDGELIYDYELALGAPLVYAVLVGLTLAIGTAYGRARDALGLRAFERRWLGVAFGVIVVAFVVGGVFQAAFGTDAGGEQGVLPETWRPDRLPALVLNTFVTVTIVPFAEELFYRGLGVRALQIFGAPVAIGATALVFALAHGILVALPGLFVFAAGLGWARVRADSI